MTNATKTTFTNLLVIVLFLAAVFAFAGCDQPQEPEPTAPPPAQALDPLIGTWQRADGYTLVFEADGTFTPGKGTSWAWTGSGTWTDADGIVTVQDNGHDVYPATYSLAGDSLTLGPDGPLQEGPYQRIGRAYGE